MPRTHESALIVDASSAEVSEEMPAFAPDCERLTVDVADRKPTDTDHLAWW
jgi:hypothetical protein